MEMAHSRPRPTNRSKLYERYDVEIQTLEENSDHKWLNEQSRETIPLEERSNIELIIMIYKTLHWKTKLITFVALIFITSMALRIARRPKAQAAPTVERIWMHPDSHQRNNPFAAEGETTYMEGILEYKHIGGRSERVQRPQQEGNGAHQALEFSLLPAKEQETLVRGQGHHGREESDAKQYSNDAHHDINGNHNQNGIK